MACKVCGFAIDRDGLCAFHQAEYSSCRKCGRTVLKLLKYCAECLSESFGRCHQCYNLIERREDVHLVRPGRQGAFGVFLCTSCHMSLTPLSYLEESSLPDLVIRWPEVVTKALTPFLAGNGFQPEAVLLAEGKDLKLTNFVAKLPTYHRRVYIGVYPTEKLDSLPSKYVRIFVGGDTAKDYICRQQKIFGPWYANACYTMGLDGHSWPEQLKDWCEAFKISYKAVAGDARWRPKTSNESDSTIYLPQLHLSDYVTNLEKLGHEKGKEGDRTKHEVSDSENERLEHLLGEIARNIA